MDYVLMSTLGAAILAWPLFQSEIPSNLGSWPLTVVVMVFCFIVIKVIRDWMNEKDAKFSERMIAKDEAFAKVIHEVTDKHAAAIQAFGDTVLQLQTSGHKRSEDRALADSAENARMRKTIDRLSAAAERLYTPKKPKK